MAITSEAMLGTVERCRKSLLPGQLTALAQFAERLCFLQGHDVSMWYARVSLGHSHKELERFERRLKACFLAEGIRGELNAAMLAQQPEFLALCIEEHDLFLRAHQCAVANQAFQGFAGHIMPETLSVLRHAALDLYGLLCRESDIDEEHWNRLADLVVDHARRFSYPRDGRLNDLQWYLHCIQQLVKDCNEQAASVVPVEDLCIQTLLDESAPQVYELEEFRALSVAYEQAVSHLHRLSYTTYADRKLGRAGVDVTRLPATYLFVELAKMKGRSHVTW